MTWYRCFIRGENFPGALIDEPGLVGFYVTRFVEAATAEETESRALQALRAEPKLAPPAGHQPSGLARVHFEEIAAFPPEEVPDTQPGFAWHPMSTDE